MKSRLALIIGSIALIGGGIATFTGMNQYNYAANANQVVAQAQTSTPLATELQGKPVVVKIQSKG